jgi:hypothetical protein
MTSRDVIGMMFFRLGVMGFPIECVLGFEISCTARPVCMHGALYKGYNARKCAKSTKTCSNPDLTHLASRDVIQTNAIRLPDGGFPINSVISLALSGKLPSFHIQEIVCMGQLTCKKLAKSNCGFMGGNTPKRITPSVFKIERWNLVWRCKIMCSTTYIPFFWIGSKMKIFYAYPPRN